MKDYLYGQRGLPYFASITSTQMLHMSTMVLSSYLLEDRFFNIQLLFAV